MKNLKPIIIIGISSGIAAYKIIELIHRLNKYDISVIMTDHAKSMIPQSEFKKIPGISVFSELFPKGFNYQKILEKRQVDHIRLADSADIMVIAPATANIIAKIAHGLADDLLTTTILATQAPVLICPSMNLHMWQNETVQENLGKIMKKGYYILPPDSGELACGYEGVGRLADTDKIIREINHIIFVKNSLSGKKIMITAGGTSESIDPVRIITNRGSGKMGTALALESVKRSAEVMLIRSKNSNVAQYQDEEIVFETVEDLSEIIRVKIINCDVIFHTAAVSDFKPVKKFSSKINSKKMLTLDFIPTDKIISKIKIWNPKVLLVGFKAVFHKTDREMIKIGKDLLHETKSDFIAVNDIGRDDIGFGVDSNEIILISCKGAVVKIDKTSKQNVASRMLETIFSI